MTRIGAHRDIFRAVNHKATQWELLMAQNNNLMGDGDIALITRLMEFADNDGVQWERVCGFASTDSSSANRATFGVPAAAANCGGDWLKVYLNNKVIQPWRFLTVLRRVRSFNGALPAEYLSSLRSASRRRKARCRALPHESAEAGE